MHRLLEGEVGSGKTVVALLAMLAVIDAGGQAALLAPDRGACHPAPPQPAGAAGPLARVGELDGADVADLATQVVLLTGSTSSASRRETLKPIADGTAGIVVGTHALLEPSVAVPRSGAWSWWTSSIASASSSATALRTRRQRATACAGDDGDADPAHGRDDRLR